MATNSLPQHAQRSRLQAESLSVTDVVSALFSPLASLKLTVFLLVMSIAVIFIATLQQASLNMWSVKHMHYDHWFVTIPFQQLLIERWFPDFQNVPGSFVIPSGKLLIYALIVNLIAAHVLRFRIKAKGVKLWLGAVTGIIAAVVTWAMSFDTFAADGFQKDPPVSYAQMWMIMQVILLGLALSCAVGMLLIESGKRIEKSILFTFAFLATAVLAIAIAIGKDAFVGDSGMRILWQLSQATIAACVAWGACILLFERKAGIVLLHFGVVGLMINDIYVNYTNDEARMSFSEGESTRVAYDVRETEFAVLDQSDPEFDQVIAIPESLFKSGELVEDSRLPFAIRCESFYDNSRMKNQPPQESDPDLRGTARRVQYTEAAPNVGSEVDQATARVELIGKHGASLGSWIVSQNIRDFVDSVSVDGKEYRIGLRFKTLYKPYELKLNDVKAEYYTGTDTPKWFSSQVELLDIASTSKTEHEIWMNNPLRYKGETFYQSGYDKSGGQEFSTLQVVRNRGWMIPYICCMFTVVGLAGQFGSSLLGFLKKAQNRPQGSSSSPVYDAQLIDADNAALSSKKNRFWKTPGFLIPAGVAALFAFYAISGPAKSVRPILHESGMRLDRLGEVPITHKGRIQPLDSFARNTARQFAKREYVYDKDLNKQPAIRWLADTMFRADGYDQYRAFRIEDLEILETFDLPIEAGEGEPKDVRFRYTLDQLKDTPPKIFAALPPRGTPESEWTLYQSRLNSIFGKIMRNVAISSLMSEKSDSAAARMDRQRGRPKGMLAGESVGFNEEYWPRFIPEGDTWKPMAHAEDRKWLLETATELGATDSAAMVSKLYDGDASFADYRKEEAMSILGQLDLSKLLFTKDRVDAAMAAGASTRPEIAKFIMDSPSGKRMRAMTFQGADQSIGEILTQINDGEEKFDVKTETLDVELAGLFEKMGGAYRDGDAETFNGLTDQYLAAVRGTDELKGQLSKLGVEKIYDGWSPFFLSMVLYLFGFVVVAFAWFFSFDRNLSKIAGRSAISIVVIALIVQCLGIVMRIYISGRAPVTNLYSSALFVSAVFVLVMLVVEAITRIGIGTAMGSIGAFGALMWAWTMSITDGDTFSVLVAVLDTQFWLSTHVVCITIGYAVNFAAGFLGLAYILATMLTPAMSKPIRKLFSNLIYGVICFALFFSFFGTVLGGLWGDDSWGRFWGWDPKENGALMIVLWSALLLHARWGGLVKERGIAILAVLGNIIVLWSWKGVNSMGVGLHAYAGSDDNTVSVILWVAFFHLVVAGIALLPTRFWWSHLQNESH